MLTDAEINTRLPSVGIDKCREGDQRAGVATPAEAPPEDCPHR